MIKEIIGDIFKQDWNVIIHQANTECTLGNGHASGIAGIIGRLYPSAKEADKNFWHYCKSENVEMLGDFSVGEIGTTRRKFVINMYGQRLTPPYEYLMRNTSYDAFEAGLRNVKSYLIDELAFGENDTIALPYLIGSDLGGGDWVIVKRIIENVFDDAPFTTLICKLPEVAEKEKKIAAIQNYVDHKSAQLAKLT